MLRRVAENTPCRECGEVPRKNRWDDDSEARYCDCGDIKCWPNYAEWIARNKPREETGDGDTSTDDLGSVAMVLDVGLEKRVDPVDGFSGVGVHAGDRQTGTAAGQVTPSALEMGGVLSALEQARSFLDGIYEESHSSTHHMLIMAMRHLIDHVETIEQRQDDFEERTDSRRAHVIGRVARLEERADDLESACDDE